MSVSESGSAKTVEEAQKFIEEGFECVTENTSGGKLFGKRKYGVNSAN